MRHSFGDSSQLFKFGDSSSLSSIRWLFILPALYRPYFFISNNAVIDYNKASMDFIKLPYLETDRVTLYL